jgi:hypothetical protein
VRHPQLGALLEHRLRTVPLSLLVGPGRCWSLLLSRRHRERNTHIIIYLLSMASLAASRLEKILICLLLPFASLPPSSACKTFFRPPPWPPDSSANVLFPNTRFWQFHPAGPRRPRGDNCSTSSHHPQRVVECLVALTRSRATFARHCPPSSHSNVPLLRLYRLLILKNHRRRLHVHASACIAAAHGTTDSLHPIELVQSIVRFHRRRAASNSM